MAMLIAYEDHRFSTHRGVDFLSLGRAALQWASHGHIVSGGSTLTMQVARLIEPRAEKTIAAKLAQMLRAVEIEQKTSKTGVLNLYLALAPYGGNIEGLRAASLAYFGHEPKRLSIAEAAFWSLCRNRRKPDGQIVIGRPRVPPATLSSTGFLHRA